MYPAPPFLARSPLRDLELPGENATLKLTLGRPVVLSDSLVAGFRWHDMRESVEAFTAFGILRARGSLLMIQLAQLHRHPGIYEQPTRLFGLFGCSERW